MIVLSTATRNVPEEKFEKLTESCSAMGYRLKMIGREEQWTGWPGRTKIVLEELERSEEEFVVLVDATDVFFVRPAEELLREIEEEGLDVPYVGAEMFIGYKDGKYSEDRMVEYYRNLCPTDEPFPNGGFLIGRRKDLIRIMRENLSQTDDQAGYIDGIYEGRLSMKLDYENRFIGNIPRGITDADIERRYFIDDGGRPVSRRSGKAPFALHFSGLNWKYMNRMYVRRYGGVLREQKTYYYLVLIFSLLSLFVLCYFVRRE